jgi:hypothetical protein
MERLALKSPLEKAALQKSCLQIGPLQVTLERAIETSLF